MSFTADLDEIVAKNENGLLRVHETWERVPAGFVVSILNGFPFDSKHFKKGGGVPLIRIRDILDSSTEVGFTGPIPDGYWIKRGDILIGMDGDFNVSHWKGSEALLNQRVCKISVDERFFQSNFFFHSVAGYLKAINEYTSSVTVKHLSSKTIAEIPLPLPPINEQKRIADKLDAILARVNACRESLDRVPAILKRFRQAVLAAATSGKLTEEWRNDNGIGIDKWETKAIEELVTIKNGRAFPSTQYTDDGVRLLRPGNLHVSGQLEWNEKNTVRLPSRYMREFPEFVLGSGELLMNLTAQSLKDEFLGRVCFKDDSEPALLNQRICAFYPKTEFDVRPYLFVYLKSPDFRKYVDTLDSGTLIKHMHSKQLLKHKLQVPITDEQVEIVGRVETLFAYAERLEARYTAARAQVERLTPALLAKAFRGELVPQDPNDEPASALLERIRASRAAAGEKPTRKVRTERKPMATTLTTDILKEIIRGLSTDQFTFDDLRGQVSADYETLKDVVFTLLSEAPASIKQVFDTEANTMRLVRVK